MSADSAPTTNTGAENLSAPAKRSPWRWMLVFFVIGGGLGFVPQWMARRAAETEVATLAALAAAQRDSLGIARLEGRVNSALRIMKRGDFEGARALMATSFSDLDARGGESPLWSSVVPSVMASRDEIITQLSRSAPQAEEMLERISAELLAAIDPTSHQALQRRSEPSGPASGSTPPPTAPSGVATPPDTAMRPGGGAP